MADLDCNGIGISLGVAEVVGEFIAWVGVVWMEVGEGAVSEEVHGVAAEGAVVAVIGVFGL